MNYGSIGWQRYNDDMTLAAPSKEHLLDDEGNTLCGTKIPDWREVASLGGNVGSSPCKRCKRAFEKRAKK